MGGFWVGLTSLLFLFITNLESSISLASTSATLRPSGIVLSSAINIWHVARGRLQTITNYLILLEACENETVVKFNSSTITLNSMETYQIESDNDLTGTRITSSKPLSVFCGSDCANVPQGIPYTVTIWLNKYLRLSHGAQNSS